jgi:ferredoxin-type protein NapF
MQDMTTRRDMLLGRFAGKAPGTAARLPVFGGSCLPGQGVVCRSCGESCEAGAIVFRPVAGGVALPALDPGRCTDCGDCAKVCPVDALVLAPAPLPQEFPA